MNRRKFLAGLAALGVAPLVPWPDTPQLSHQTWALGAYYYGREDFARKARLLVNAMERTFYGYDIHYWRSLPELHIVKDFDYNDNKIVIKARATGIHRAVSDLTLAEGMQRWDTRSWKAIPGKPYRDLGITVQMLTGKELALEYSGKLNFS